MEREREGAERARATRHARHAAPCHVMLTAHQCIHADGGSHRQTGAYVAQRQGRPVQQVPGRAVRVSSRAIRRCAVHRLRGLLMHSLTLFPLSADTTTCSPCRATSDYATRATDLYFTRPCSWRIANPTHTSCTRKGHCTAARRRAVHAPYDEQCNPRHRITALAMRRPSGMGYK